MSTIRFATALLAVCGALFAGAAFGAPTATEQDVARAAGQDAQLNAIKSELRLLNGRVGRSIADDTSVLGLLYNISQSTANTCRAVNESSFNC